MSNSSVSKNRFHKGITAALRRSLRRAGVSLDEEQAQFSLARVKPFAGQPDEVLTEAINRVLADRFRHMQDWEHENPNRNPYAPSFPERVLALVRAAVEEFDRGEEGEPRVPLIRLMRIAEAETRTDVFRPADDAPIL